MVSISTSQQRRRATLAARVTAGVVAGLALSLLAFNALGAASPSSTTPNSSSTTTVASPESTQTTITKTTGARPSSNTVEVVSPKTDQTATVVSSPGRDTSVLGNIFANPGSTWLLDFVIVLAVAFFAGAAMQRIWVGEYGIKLGAFQLESLPVTVDAAASALAQVPAPAGTPPTAPNAPSFWWNEDPRDAPDEVTEILLRRAALQAAAREIAANNGVGVVADFEKQIRSLIRSDAPIGKALGESLLELDELGHRIQHGANLEEGAGRVLIKALTKATRVLASAAS